MTDDKCAHIDDVRWNYSAKERKSDGWRCFVCGCEFLPVTPERIPSPTTNEVRAPHLRASATVQAPSETTIYGPGGRYESQAPRKVGDVEYVVHPGLGHAEGYAFATQLPPVHDETSGPEVWPLVIKDVLAVTKDASADLRNAMLARHEFGKAKYGVPLRVWDGRNPRVDAFDEVLDLCVYFKRWLLRIGEGGDNWKEKLGSSTVVGKLYGDALRLAAELAYCVTLVPLQPPEVKP